MSKKTLSNLRVGRRLGLAFGAVGALVLVSTGVGLSAVSEQRDIAADLSAAEGVSQEAESARFQIADVSGWQGLVMADVAAFGPEVALAPDAYNRAGMLESKDAVYAWMDGVDTSAMDADERSTWAELEPAWDNYFAMDDQVVAWVSDGSVEGFRTAVESINGGEAGEGYGIILDIADRLETSADARADQLREDQTQAQERATVLLGSVGALAVVLSAILATLAARSVVRPLRRVRASLDAAGRGDLTVESGVDRRDEVGEMAESVADMQRNLRQVLASLGVTVLGAQVNGEGIIGLTRGFMYAGAPRVVSSLWQVADRPSSELMKRFYTGMLGPKKLSAAAALRQAQLDLWRDETLHSPYYWAAFVLQGEYK